MLRKPLVSIYQDPAYVFGLVGLATNNSKREAKNPWKWPERPLSQIHCAFYMANHEELSCSPLMGCNSAYQVFITLV
jgi:hypothetical protein